MSRDLIDDTGLMSVAGIEALYQDYQANPASVPASWVHYFRSLDGLDIEASASQPRPTAPAVDVKSPAPQQSQDSRAAPADDLKVFNLINAYRTYGHRKAQINPISTESPAHPTELALQKFGLSEADLQRSFPSGGITSSETASLQEIIEALEATYCSTIGVEYIGLQNAEMESWLQQHIEPKRFRPELSIDQKRLILEHLNKSELFEAFLHTKYPGQKRFSLEGGETLIPILASILDTGSQLGLQEFYVAMAHRGRLNVLANILNKSYGDIFTEFESGYIPNTFEGSGDVKYHKGFSSRFSTGQGKEVAISLAANPSHLEAVNALVLGQVRARQIQLRDERTQEKVVPIIIHGDAAISGQGIVYETMQLYRLRGYSSGGSIHIVINNQIGFTTLPKDSRSTLYCTDIARTFGAPVFHVNGEDPEGCVYATNLAIELRQRFHCDVVIELNCYRKYGHNEGDEPAFTQPLEYQLIHQKRPVRELYRDNLIQQGVLERQVAEQLESEFKASLQKALDSKREEVEGSEKLGLSLPEQKAPDFGPVETAVPLKRLQELTQNFCSIPSDFSINRKLKRVIDARAKMLDGDPKSARIDWGMGEHLAFASLLDEGVHVRLSGQDSRRGTFSQRHAMWVDQKTAGKHFPLSKLHPKQGRFDVFNSPLSEYGVMGFEMGYAQAFEEALVCWEAQFGDFCNGAQIIIDQFLSTSEQKWGSAAPLTLLLPHGYEGQGPEHSSARMERFLQLCGDNNMRVVDPSTPAQLFHLLRRQVKSKEPKPLIVFTPKALLRLPACVSAPEELSTGSFQEIIDDPKDAKGVERLIFCTGKVYYDLLAEREKRGAEDTRIIRIEQLYPIHRDGLRAVVAKYPKIKHCFWAQEEPRNMGAWHFIKPFLQREYVGTGIEVAYAGRPRSASPAAGSLALHSMQHQALLEHAFCGVQTLDSEELDPGMAEIEG
jgi:2-oxoglutarate dehydrogenase E1 component